MCEMGFTIEEFRNVPIFKVLLENPDYNRFEDPVPYLYQLGYLSLRPSSSSDEYVLDYSNTEVLQSIVMHLLRRYFTSSILSTKIRQNVKDALISRDCISLIHQLNRLLIKIPYDYYGKTSRDEAFYCGLLFTLFYTIALELRAQEHGHLGRSDFVIKYGNQTWVIEVKISHKDSEDTDLAKAACDQIVAKDYGAGYKNPVLLGLVVNDEKRVITAWCRPGQNAMIVEPKTYLEPEDENKEQNKEASPEQSKVPSQILSKKPNLKQSKESPQILNKKPILEQSTEPTQAKSEEENIPPPSPRLR
jgi:hypothetical protein